MSLLDRYNNYKASQCIENNNLPENEKEKTIKKKKIKEGHVCECGGIVTEKSMPKHLVSAKHLKYTNKQPKESKKFKLPKESKKPKESKESFIAKMKSGKEKKKLESKLSTKDLKKYKHVENVGGINVKLYTFTTDELNGIINR